LEQVYFGFQQKSMKKPKNIHAQNRIYNREITDKTRVNSHYPPENQANTFPFTSPQPDVKIPLAPN